MQTLVLSRKDNIKPRVKRFLEQSAGGRNPYDTLIFIDHEDNVRVAGDDIESRYGAAVNAYTPAATLSLPNGEKAAKVFATRFNLFIISTLNNLYATGNNTNGNCALPAGSGLADVIKPTLTAISNCKTVAVPTGHSMTASAMFLTYSGVVYSAGWNQYGQLGDGTQTQSGDTGPRLTLGPGNTYGNPTTTVVDVIGVGARDVSSGNWGDSFCALLSNGEVWCVGFGGRGQMGNNTTTDVNTLWRQVRYVTTDLPIQNVVRIFGSGAQAEGRFYALDSSGNLYGWGANGQGQLAIGTTGNVTRATLSSTNVLDVWPFTSIWGSLIVKKTDNQFYGAGHNGYGQLGVGDLINKSSLTLISSLSDKNIEQIYVCGPNAPHVWAKAANSNRIYVTGHNGQGQHGTYGTTQITSFTEVPFNVSSPIIDIMPIYTQDIGGYTLILTADGQTYFTGQTRWNYAGDPARNVLSFCQNTAQLVGG